MKLSQLLEGLDYELIQGEADIDINNIHNDSRQVGQGDLFFCIAGAVADGHRFAADVVSKGASALIVEKDVELETDDEQSVAVVKVKSTRYAMGVISSKYYGEPSKKLTVIGITGTKGKTTTTYMIREMLVASGIDTGLIGTIEIIDGKQSIPAKNTTPESILLHRHLKDMVDNGMKAVVMEVSSQGLMLDRVAGVDFDYGIFTNLSKDHIGPNEHSSFEEYMMWKSKLFQLCRVGIFNIDDKHTAEIMKTSTCEQITYSIEDESDYSGSELKLYSKEGVLGIEYKLSGKMDESIVVDMPGEFTAHNSLAAIAVADSMGVPAERIKSILEDIKVRGRVELIPISDEFTILIDYAHNAMALESLYTAIKAYEPKRLVSLFGCGGNRSRDRRFEMGQVSGDMADLTIITSDNPRNEEPLAIIEDIKTGISKTGGEYVAIADRKEAIRYAIMNACEGDVIVLAGKGHEDYQEICGQKYHMDERDLIREILEEEDVTKICGYNNRYFA